MEKGTSGKLVKNGRIGAANKAETLQMGLVILEKALGKSISSIAEEFSISPAKVRFYLSQHEAEAFVEHYRKVAYDRLGGKALAVYEARLALGDLDAARDILYGLGVLQKEPKIGTKSQPQVIDTIDAYRHERQKEQKETKNAEIRQRSAGIPRRADEGGGDGEGVEGEFPGFPGNPPEGGEFEGSGD